MKVSNGQDVDWLPILDWMSTKGLEMWLLSGPEQGSLTPQPNSKHFNKEEFVHIGNNNLVELSQKGLKMMKEAKVGGGGDACLTPAGPENPVDADADAKEDEETQSTLEWSGSAPLGTDSSGLANVANGQSLPRTSCPNTHCRGWLNHSVSSTEISGAAKSLLMTSGTRTRQY